MDQLSLFDPDPDPRAGPIDGLPDAPGSSAPGPLDPIYQDASRIAVRLPDRLAFGTSSWSFPGWKGQVYAETRSQAVLAREGLREYARHPLLRTVGIDRTYYAPVSDSDLRRYAAQLPAGFRACAKAPASVMSATVPGSTRGGSAVPNPSFLCADDLLEELIEPFARSFGSHCGPFILEAPPLPRDSRWEPAAVLDRLFEMLTALPREFQYAVELRDVRLLNDDYARLLEAAGAGHVYNYWSAMPRLAAQAEVVPPERLPVTVVRLLLRPGTRYEDQRERFRPFDRIVEPDQAMRNDVVELIRRATRAKGPAYVLVNNKAEGSAPLTIRELAALVADQIGREPGAGARPGT